MKSAKPIREKRTQPRTDYVHRLLTQIRAFKHPVPAQEVLFHPTRKWRFDLAWPELKVAVEYQGGIFSRQASHSSISHIMRDQQKGNEAQLHGWIVIYANAATVNSGQAIDWINRAIELRKGEK